MKINKSDEQWMEVALEQAKLAGLQGEVPVGAALVKGGELLAKAGNSPISLHDPTAHAEILALRIAATKECNYRLSDSTLYVTLEPCTMCVGAIIHARVKRVVFGAKDPKTGALISLYTIGEDGLLNHSLEITGGVFADRCSSLLKNFFSSKRKKRTS